MSFRLTIVLLLLLPSLAFADDGGASLPDRGAILDRLSALENKIDRLEDELRQRPKDAVDYPLPMSMSFCGEAVDLSRAEVRERVWHELMLVLRDRAQVSMWRARQEKVFPRMREAAKSAKACTDLLYVAVTESGLRAAVTSRASAKGWWQFMRPTARQFGLRTFESWDDRADLDKSTRAGLEYLEALNVQFDSYLLAMAAYNTGPGRLRRSIDSQGVSDYWLLDLYTEAERYVPRTLAIKLVLDEPEKFGFFGEPTRFKQTKKGYVRLLVPKGIDLSVVALSRGVSVPVRLLRSLNPELGAQHLPRGERFTLTVPAGKEKHFRLWVEREVSAARTKLAKSKRLAERKRRDAKKREANRRAKAKRAKAKKRSKKLARASGGKKTRKKTYRVRPGDSLWSIANRHSVTVKQLRRWNRMNGKTVIKTGRVLVIQKGT